MVSNGRIVRRVFTVLGATAAVLGSTMIAASADAPDPLPPPTASMVGRTLTIEGQWAWTTHATDCNSDRYAVGYAVAWNDESDPASSGAVSTNLVQNTTVTPHITAYVGTSTDDAVHWIHKVGESNPNGDPVGATRCGTYDTVKKYNSGHWGPITHTYGGTQTSFHVCAVTYDVHNGPLVNGVAQPDSKDLIAGGPNHATDNSIEKNANTPIGNQCFDIAVPTVTTQTSSASVTTGSSVADTATISNYSQSGPPTGTVTFELFSSLDPSAANHCGTQVASYSSTKAVTLVGGSYQATSDGISTLPVGSYFWLAKYNGDNATDPAQVHNAAVSALCDADNESFTVTPAGTPAINAHKTSDPASGTAASPASVSPGQVITYTVAVDNSGQADATDVHVSDVVPTGTTFVSVSSVGSGSYDAGSNTVSWTVNVAKGATALLTFQARVPDAAVNGTLIDNTATFSNLNTPGCETATCSTETTHHEVRFAVLTMAKSSSPASGSIVQRGDRINYTITVTNTGLAPATGVTVTDTLPEHVRLVPGSSLPAFTTNDGSVVTWTTTVPAATQATVPGSVTMTYAVTVDADAPEGATLTNVALVNDRCVGNSDTSVCTTEHHVPTGALTLIKHVDKTTATYGDTLTYTFDASTTGALDQTAVVVRDVLPKGTSYVAGSARCTDAGPCSSSFDDASRTVTWQLGDMAAHATRHLAFKVTIATPSFDPQVGLPPETIVNSGVIASTETPATPSNQVVTKVVAVLGVKVVRQPPRLPFTGVPASELLLAGLTMLGAGIILTSVRRRRERSCR